MDIPHTIGPDFGRRAGAAAGPKERDRLHARAHRSADLHGRLLTATRTPKRTLRKHFLSSLGSHRSDSYCDCVLCYQGIVARHTQAAASPISPARFGFTHFGRFSRDYRRCFGECLLHPPPGATSRSLGSRYRNRRGAVSIEHHAYAGHLAVPDHWETGKATGWPKASGVARGRTCPRAALSVRLAPAAKAAAKPRLGGTIA